MTYLFVDLLYLQIANNTLLMAASFMDTIYRIKEHKDAMQKVKLHTHMKGPSVNPKHFKAFAHRKNKKELKREKEFNVSGKLLSIEI